MNLKYDLSKKSSKHWFYKSKFISSSKQIRNTTCNYLQFLQVKYTNIQRKIIEYLS